MELQIANPPQVSKTRGSPIPIHPSPAVTAWNHPTDGDVPPQLYTVVMIRPMPLKNTAFSDKSNTTHAYRGDPLMSPLVVVPSDSMDGCILVRKGRGRG